MQRPVVFKNEGHDIYGVLHLPKGTGLTRHVPAVVLCHGFMGSKVEAHRLFVKFSRLLESYRIASLRFDFRGCGDSGGDYRQFTIMDEVSDALKAIDFLSAQVGVNRERIGLLGFSLGSIVASYAAARHQLVRSLALWAPPVDLLWQQKRLNKQIKMRKSYIRPRYIDYHGTLVGMKFIGQLPQIKPLEEVQNFYSPVFIAHGTKDDTVPLMDSFRLYRALHKNKIPVERFLIKGADHIFSNHIWQQILFKRTLRFFAKNI